MKVLSILSTKVVVFSLKFGLISEKIHLKTVLELLTQEFMKLMIQNPQEFMNPFMFPLNSLLSFYSLVKISPNIPTHKKSKISANSSTP